MARVRCRGHPLLEVNGYASAQILVVAVADELQTARLCVEVVRMVAAPVRLPRPYAGVALVVRPVEHHGDVSTVTAVLQLIRQAGFKCRKIVNFESK